MMPQKYDDVWHDLNGRLELIRETEGLDGALRALERYHQDNGFVRDRAERIARFKFHHPQHPERFLRVQFNPRRALRRNGSGIKTPPPGIRVINNGCFLCRDNIAWQQQGAEVGYELDLDGQSCIAWMNPFPLLPTHVVLAPAAHITQEWSYHEGGGQDVDDLLHTLVSMSAQLPGYVGFYNGVGAGASIPGHLHFHFSRRPEDDPRFPLESAADDFVAGKAEPGLVQDYPLDVAVWRGTGVALVTDAASWVARWAERNRSRLPAMSANFIVTTEPETGVTSVYFAPRWRNHVSNGVMSGLIGGLEVLGEFVYTVIDEKARLENGAVDYFSLEYILREIHTPLYPE
jgi:diadenosine tetraphosphate (Ap4A) HIT family hydrolase